ncbi:hypothetical protein [Jannaschia sp. R86511]|uniref:hypothetical protein n=1 Tax=Jannaschia sp. R86511 TaxID=3093853 RepID=UPI0036D394B7
MATRPGTATRPGRGTVRVALLLGLTTAVVLGLTLVARDPPSSLSATDVARIEAAVDQGCPGSGDPLGRGTGFALDGTVVDLDVPAGRGASRVTLRVREWFLGPPLGAVTVWLEPGTVPQPSGDGGEPGPGTRLLVSGRDWQDRDGALVASGCGRTRAWDAGTADQWRRTLAAPGLDERVAPTGPLATYPSAGFVRDVREPDLRGVAVLDGDCLYVQDGRTRWVPVLPNRTTAWLDAPPSLAVAGVRTDVGHLVRFAGVPAGGPVPRGADGTARADVTAALVDPSGVPAACDPAAPRFVVAERTTPAARPDARAGVTPVGLTADAARRAGLRPTAGSGGVVTDAFGATTSRVALQTVAAGEVLVHVESVAVLAWPHAYAAPGADLLRSADPDQAAALPPVAPGHELAVVSREDGVTQVLLRTPSRVVVSVSARLTPDPSGPGDTDGGGVALEQLAQVAVEVAALSPSGAGS